MRRPSSGQKGEKQNKLGSDVERSNNYGEKIVVARSILKVERVVIIVSGTFFVLFNFYFKV